MKILNFSLFTLLLLCFSSCETDLINSSFDLQPLEIQEELDDCFFDDYCLIESNPIIQRNYQKKVSIRSGNLNSFIEAVKDDITQNHKGSSKRLKQKFGFPGWSAAFVSNLEDQQVAFIPFAHDDSQFTEAVLIIYRRGNGKFKYHVINRNNLNKYRSKAKGGDSKLSIEMALIKLLYFDRELFGTTDCDLVKIAERFLPRSESGINSIETRSTCTWILTVDETQWYVNGSYVDSTWDYSFDIFCDDEGPSDDPNEGGGGGYDPNNDPNNTGGNDGGYTGPLPAEDNVAPCITGSDITTVGTSHYVDFDNLAVNFVHVKSNGVNVRNINYPSLCLQVKPRGGKASTANLIKIAFRSAVNGTEAWLNTNYPNSDPSALTIKNMLNQRLEAALHAQFGGGQQTSVNYLGCQGIPVISNPNMGC